MTESKTEIMPSEEIRGWEIGRSKFEFDVFLQISRKGLRKRKKKEYFIFYR